MNLSWAPYTLNFTFDAKTSRATMRRKDTWFIRMEDEQSKRVSVGEAAYFEGLSPEPRAEFESELRRVCRNGKLESSLSSVRFAIESALINQQRLADNEFTQGRIGIPINGLIWMGDFSTMRRRIDEKLEQGFNVLKLKIGGIRFDDELDLLRHIRRRYSASTVELRLDANGAFNPSDALEKLKRLSDFEIHSIEQPIKAGLYDDMGALCAQSPIDIALDEDLIGTRSQQEKEAMLSKVAPAYIILKPSLCGGLSGANEWADLAEKNGIGWWATSALESNVGLLNLALWVFERGVTMPQGLGTGMLYDNNFRSALELRGSKLYFNPDKICEFPDVQWQR